MKTLIVMLMTIFYSFHAWAESPRFSSVRVETNYSKVEITAEDKNSQKIKFQSNNNLGLSLSFAEHFNEKNTTNLKIQYNTLDFNKSFTWPIDNLDQTLLILSVGHTYSVSNDFRLSDSLLLAEELFIRSKNSGTIYGRKFMNGHSLEESPFLLGTNLFQFKTILKQ